MDVSGSTRDILKKSYFLLNFVQFKSGQRELTCTSVDKNMDVLFRHCGAETKLKFASTQQPLRHSDICHEMTICG